MNERIKKKRDFLISHDFKGTQTFNTRNTVGDRMVTIYEDDVTVDYCPYYEYLEIFGLSGEEYRSLSDILDIC